MGIDVGGTNTDAVLYDSLNGKILTDIKIPTIHSDYEKSISDAVESLLGNSSADSSDISSLNISTTLSTNALLEKRGSPVYLVLIGFSSYPHIVREIESIIKPAEILNVRGGHTGWGKQREALDVLSIELFAKNHRKQLFAVSSMYSPRNPEHEITARNIFASEGCLGVTCGYELAHSRLNAVKRTVTAYLNSSLVPLTEKLISGVQNVAEKYGLNCPLMFLRSDSSLVSSDWCRKFPLETIFSGPAASVRGAYLLSGLNEESIKVIDMGGTSTDIGSIKNGRAVFSEEGAAVGSYRTMIPSLDIKTIALGGDSIVRTDMYGNISVGPERSLPLCRLYGAENINCDDLRDFLSADCILNDSDELHFIAVPSKINRSRLSDTESGIADFVNNRAVLLRDFLKYLMSVSSSPDAVCEILDSARRNGVVIDCTYTPTDALVARGIADIEDGGISLMAAERLGSYVNASGEIFADKVRACVSGLLEEAVSADRGESGESTRIYVGTPVRGFVPHPDEKACRCIFPDKGSVASAVGAAASSLELSCSVSVLHSFSEESYTAFLPLMTIKSDDLEDILCRSEKNIKKYLSEQAESMGYVNAEVSIERNFYYLDKVRSVSALTFVLLDCRAIVHNA